MRAAILATAAFAVEIATAQRIAQFVEVLLLAAAAAEVAIGHQVLERGRDEPVLEALLRSEERRLNDELERRRDWCAGRPPGSDQGRAQLSP